MYVSTSTAKRFYGVSSDTLRRWATSNKIKFITTKGGHRRYFVPDNIQIGQKNSTTNSSKIIYARVSSSKQKHDLQHQIEYLSNLFPNYTVISDIGSGLNFKRKGLKRLLDRLFKGDIEEVVVSNKDRLARFGFELIKDIFTRFNARIVVVNDTGDRPFKEELAEDILSIITFFTARYSGKRKYHKKYPNAESGSDAEEGDESTDQDTEFDSESDKDSSSDGDFDTKSESGIEEASESTSKTDTKGGQKTGEHDRVESKESPKRSDGEPRARGRPRSVPRSKKEESDKGGVKTTQTTKNQTPTIRTTQSRFSRQIRRIKTNQISKNKQSKKDLQR